MGKHTNSAIYGELEREQRRRQPLTEAEWESSYSDWKWDKDDATAAELAEARRVYAAPVRSVRLFDEYPGI